MLELPYLEVYAEIFEKRFKNRVLEKIDIQEEECIHFSKAELSEQLVGSELKKVWREGLSLCFQFSNYTVLGMTFFPTAALQVIEHSQEADAGLLNLYFGGGQVISVKNVQELSLLRNGVMPVNVPDVFSREMTYEYLVDLFSNREEEIKSVLLDQRLIRGIGEAFADEILWYAEISPFSIAGKIPADRIKILHRTIKYVLLDAIKEIKRINFMKLDEMESNLLMIHNPNKELSPTGKFIKVEIRDKTTTHYTDEQILYV